MENAQDIKVDINNQIEQKANCNDFVHLHLHTEYSLLDGATRINKLFDRVKELGMNAVAITDHGNMYGVYKFFLQSKKNKVKAIIGCELYIVDDMTIKNGRVTQDFNHIVLLAKNDVGYRNLVKLDSIAFVDGFYYKPRIDFKLLSQYHEGIICLSACLAGQLPRLVLDNRIDDAEKLVLQYKALFGDDYYIEIQDHGIEEQKYSNPKLIELARKCDVKLVATNDVHYINRQDAEKQDILMCVQMGKTLDDTNRMKFTGSEFYLKSGEEMSAIFSYVKDAIANTREIANKCNVEINRQDLVPNFVPDNGMTAKEYLRFLMEEGLKEKYKVITPEIRQRAEYEYGVISSMGFVEYYLIVWDYIHYAESQGIPVGPGRGSGAGSIIAYAIGITKIEPLRYNLIFERFLNKDRISMPDFDVDFCVDRRGEVIDYVKKKYGASKVAQIVTFGTMASKAAIKDVARVLRVPYDAVNKVTKLIPTGKYTLKQLMGLEKHKEDGDVHLDDLITIFNTDDTMRRVLDNAMALEGSPRNTSMHAAGVVMCKNDISDFIPLQRSGDDITTQFDMTEVEALGMLKMDFLGLRTLTDINNTLKLIEEETGKRIHLSTDTFDDAKVFEMIGNGDVDAVFQLEGGGMKRFMRDLKPTCLEDLVAGISLYRPGPMGSIPKYVAGKHNPDKVEYKHPLLKPILDVTYGCMVYQEQVMQIVRDLAGFTMGQADEIRKAMGKKKTEIIAAKRKEFIFGKKDEQGNVIVDGAIRRGVSEEIANDIYDEMQAFGTYAFNKSHAAAYAVITYHTAYLKCFYPLEYIASVLNNRISNIDDIKKYIASCINSGTNILPPDINKSQHGFSVENGQIRFGLAAIKGVGSNVIREIVELRKSKGEFINLEDFLMRVDNKLWNKRLVENLIKAGAFDCFGKNRSQLMASYENMMDILSKEKKQRESGQFSMFEILQENVFCYDYPKIDEYNNKYKLSLEKEVLGMYISGNPLDDYKDKLKQFSFNTSMVASVSSEDIEEGDINAEAEVDYSLDNTDVVIGGILGNVEKKTTKKGQSMAVAKLEDLYGNIEVVFYSQVYDSVKDLLIDDSLVTISGRLSLRAEDKPKITAKKVEVWKDGAVAADIELSVMRLYIKMPNDDELFAQTTSILKNYEGDCDCMFAINGKSLLSSYKVRNCQGVVYELEALLGSGNIKFVEVKKK